MLCPGHGRHVVGVGKDGLIREYGKGESLLCVAVKAQLLIRHYPAPRQQLSDVPHERRVQRSASADDEAGRRLRRIVAHRRGYALRGKARRRCEHVQKPDALSLGACAERCGIIRAVALAPCRFWRALRKVWVVQHAPQELFTYVPLRGERAARVVGRRAIRQARGDSVHDHVARPGVKRKDVVQTAPGGEKADVAYPADVLQGDALCLTAVEQKLRIRHERRAEPARRHISYAEVPHDRA